jgi:hypothetical protein
METDVTCEFCSKLLSTYESATLNFFSLAGKRDIARFAQRSAALSALELELTVADRIKFLARNAFRQHQLVAHGIQFAVMATT